MMPRSAWPAFLFLTLLATSAQGQSGRAIVYQVDDEGPARPSLVIEIRSEPTPPAPPAPLAPPANPFHEGNWVAMTYASYSEGVLSDVDRVRGVHAGIGYFFMDYVSFNVQLSAYTGERLSSSIPNDDIHGA